MTNSGRQPTVRGARILRRLEEMSLSIAEVARRTPLTKNTISNAIYGPREPQRKTIEILAETLEVPVEVLTRSEDEHPADGVGLTAGALGGSLFAPSFGRWLLRRRNPALWVSLAGALATGWVLQRELPQTAAVQLVHAAVILLLLLFLPRPRLSTELYQRASLRLRLAMEASGDLRKRWEEVWLFWFLLYVSLTVAFWRGYLPSSEPVAATPWVLLGLNLIQNWVTISLLSCYEIVALPTIRDDFSRLRASRRSFWLGVLVSLTLGELICVLSVPDPQVQLWFGFVSGFGQGTALALLVGRFDSKFVDPPAAVIGLLYFYAAIQGAWPVLPADSSLNVVLTFAALVLKCLLFLFVTWLFDSQIIQFYLARMRRLEQSVRRDRSEFLVRLASGDVEDL